MPTQTSYFQQDVLRAAQRDGTLANLRWFIEAEFPRRMLRPGIKRCQPAQWPHGFIPTLPAGPDAEEQKTWAELLCGLFESGNCDRGITFKPTLTTSDLLSGLTWYTYGEVPDYEVDHICQKCGQIHRARLGTSIRCECYEW